MIERVILHMVELYRLTDVRDGREYYCKSKAVLQTMISRLTGLPRTSNAVKAVVADGTSDNFKIETFPFYTRA